jgi:hypothetical protein
MHPRIPAAASACLCVIALAGCANNVVDRITYKGADASCITTPYRSLNNPFDDVAQVYFVRLDGHDTGGMGSWTGPPKDLCVSPGDHAIEMSVMKGYSSASMFFRMSYLPNAHYRLDASLAGHDFNIRIVQVDGASEAPVMTLNSAAATATPQMPIILPPPARK